MCLSVCLKFPALFLSLPPSSRVCVSPAQMCQLEVSLPWLPCHPSCGSCCGSVWGRWRRSSSGRWRSWRRRRASSTMKQQPTANAPRALSIPSWRGSPSSRTVSDTMSAVKRWSDLETGFNFLHFLCLPDLALISQSLCKFLMMQVKTAVFIFSEPFLKQLLVLKMRLGNQH